MTFYKENRVDLMLGEGGSTFQGDLLRDECIGQHGNVKYSTIIYLDHIHIIDV
jgi:hypothetical protein